MPGKRVFSFYLSAISKLIRVAYRPLIAVAYQYSESVTIQTLKPYAVA